jgi:acetoacetyl-CoA synthetase
VALVGRRPAGLLGLQRDYFELQSPTPHDWVLKDEAMPGAQWFSGAQLNYPQHLLRHADVARRAGHPAIVFGDELLLQRAQLRETSWPDLRRRVASCAAALKRIRVRRGDRVCAALPKIPETLVVFLAAASLGAIRLA